MATSSHEIVEFPRNCCDFFVNGFTFGDVKTMICPLNRSKTLQKGKSARISGKIQNPGGGKMRDPGNEVWVLPG